MKKKGRPAGKPSARKPLAGEGSGGRSHSGARAATLAGRTAAAFENAAAEARGEVERLHQEVLDLKDEAENILARAARDAEAKREEAARLEAEVGEILSRGEEDAEAKRKEAAAVEESAAALSEKVDTLKAQADALTAQAAALDEFRVPPVRRRKKRTTVRKRKKKRAARRTPKAVTPLGAPGDFVEVERELGYRTDEELAAAEAESDD